MPERKAEFTRLCKLLRPQAKGRDIEILVARQPAWTISRKRQWCLDRAKGEYINFIDDDDLIAENYVDAIYPLLDGVDYIGFQLQFYYNGEPWAPTYHSLRYDGWSSDVNGHYRDVSHLNPMRTAVAREGRFDGGHGEDFRWGRQVHPKTEHYIHEIMYYYYFSPESSLALRCG